MNLFNTLKFVITKRESITRHLRIFLIFYFYSFNFYFVKIWCKNLLNRFYSWQLKHQNLRWWWSLNIWTKRLTLIKFYSWKSYFVPHPNESSIKIINNEHESYLIYVHFTLYFLTKQFHFCYNTFLHQYNNKCVCVPHDLHLYPIGLINHNYQFPPFKLVQRKPKMPK